MPDRNPTICFEIFCFDLEFFKATPCMETFFLYRLALFFYEKIRQNTAQSAIQTIF